MCHQKSQKQKLDNYFLKNAISQRSTVHSRQQIVAQWILAFQLKCVFSIGLQLTVVRGLWTVDIILTFATTFGSLVFCDSSL